MPPHASPRTTTAFLVIALLAFTSPWWCEVLQRNYPVQIFRIASVIKPAESSEKAHWHSKQGGTPSKKLSRVTHANRSREFCISLTSSCTDSMWETSQRTSVGFGTAVQLHNSLHTRTVHPMHWVNTLQFYTAKSAEPAFPPHPPTPQRLRAPQCQGCLSSLTGNEKIRERAYRNGRGMCMCRRTHNTRTLTSTLAFADTFWTLEMTDTHF